MPGSYAGRGVRDQTGAGTSPGQRSATASARCRTSSFRYARLMWLATVAGASPRRYATDLLEWPGAAQARMSRSRAVSTRGSGRLGSFLRTSTSRSPEFPRGSTSDQRPSTSPLQISSASSGEARRRRPRARPDGHRPHADNLETARLVDGDGSWQAQWVRPTDRGLPSANVSHSTHPLHPVCAPVVPV